MGVLRSNEKCTDYSYDFCKPHVCLSSNSYAGTLTPGVMVFGGQAFGRGIGHEGGALAKGINGFVIQQGAP